MPGTGLGVATEMATKLSLSISRFVEAMTARRCWAGARRAKTLRRRARVSSRGLLAPPAVTPR
jgi:hypothetical protein